MAQPLQTEKSIFLAAVEIESDTERDAFVEKACTGNPQLRAEVDALLKAHGRPQPLLDVAPTPGPTIAQTGSETDGNVIGPYKLIEPIGNRNRQNRQALCQTKQTGTLPESEERGW